VIRPGWPTATAEVPGGQERAEPSRRAPDPGSWPFRIPVTTSAPLVISAHGSPCSIVCHRTGPCLVIMRPCRSRLNKPQGFRAWIGPMAEALADQAGGLFGLRARPGHRCEYALRRQGQTDRRNKIADENCTACSSRGVIFRCSGNSLRIRVGTDHNGYQRSGMLRQMQGDHGIPGARAD